MGTLDFILNLAALLMWLSWRSARHDAITHPRALTLAATLKRADTTPGRSWKLPVALLVLLPTRALLYWKIGSSVNWTPGIPLVAVNLYFRSDYLGHMLLFSLLGFMLTTLCVYFALMLFSLVNHGTANANPLLRLVQMQLGRLDHLLPPVKAIFPLLAGAFGWIVLHPLLVRMEILGSSRSIGHTLQQGLVVGLGTYVTWEYVIGITLFLHLINSYVFLGSHPLWSLVNETSRRLLLPLRWLPLRFGRVDFAPLAGIALVFLIGQQLPARMPMLFQRLPW